MQLNLTQQKDIDISKPGKEIKCFVSAPLGTDLSNLVSILEENGIEVLDSSQFALGAAQITDRIIDAINSSDLFIGILNSANLNANVFYELGSATAFNKRILVIVPDEYEIPSDLDGLVSIKSDLSNREAINFALEQILNAPKSDKRVKKDLPGKTIPLGKEADIFLKELADLEKTKFEREIEKLVRLMLESSGISIISESKYKDNRSDFAVWVNELEPYFGNPILVEVKKQMTNSMVKYTIEQSRHYMSLSKVRAVMVFSLSIPADVAANIPKLPNIFFFDLSQLLDILRDKSLGEVIRDRRNSLVHGISE